jgi:hypothetical protein
MGDAPPPSPQVIWSHAAQEETQSAQSPTTGAPPAPAAGPSGATLALTIVMWIVWVGVIVVADLLGFLMFAFADSPGAGRAAQMMIAPAVAWIGFTFVAGAALLLFRRGWTIALAFVLAISPPFVVFAGYNLLDGAGSSASGGSANVTSGSSPINPPPVDRHVPPGGFVPPPMKVREQPDFQEAIRRATQPSSQPSSQSGDANDTSR